MEDHLSLLKRVLLSSLVKLKNTKEDVYINNNMTLGLKKVAAVIIINYALPNDNHWLQVFVKLFYNVWLFYFKKLR